MYNFFFKNMLYNIKKYYLYNAFDGKRENIEQKCSTRTQRRKPSLSLMGFNFDIMKEIQLSKKGKYKGMYVALVDDEDFERVNQFSWFVCIRNNTFYAGRYIRTENKLIQQHLHWEIMGAKGIDHIDGNGLNCQKYNMRECTHHQNMMNRRLNINSTTKFKGVCRVKDGYRCHISINGKQHIIGTYQTKVQAAFMYNVHAKIRYGEFSNLNIITINDIESVKPSILDQICKLENELNLLKQIIST
jgi:hypothetical protein